MKLRINNLCRVADADLDFDGITIIVGKNNTGKSTIGKALFSAFSLFAVKKARISATFLSRAFSLFPIRRFTSQNIMVRTMGVSPSTASKADAVCEETRSALLKRMPRIKTPKQTSTLTMTKGTMFRPSRFFEEISFSVFFFFSFILI